MTRFGIAPGVGGSALVMVAISDFMAWASCSKASRESSSESEGFGRGGFTELVGGGLGGGLEGFRNLGGSGGWGLKTWHAVGERS